MRLIRNYRAFVSGIGIGIGSENTENAHNRAIENKIGTIFCFLYKKEKKHCLSLYNRANGGANKRESNAAVEMAMNRVEDPSNIPLCHH